MTADGPPDVLSVALDLDALKSGGRDAAGRFQPGNLAGLRHGLRVSADHPDLTAALSERAEAITADLGGMSHLSAVQLPLVRELARLQLISESLGHDVIAFGPLTGKGRTRAAVTVYLAVLDRHEKLARLLGLDRRTKPSGLTHLRDYLDGRTA